MDKLVPALLVAGLSGLTVLAYQHPDAYKTMMPFLLFGIWGLWTLIWVLISAWQIGAGKAHLKLIPFLRTDDQEAAQSALDEMMITTWWIHIVVCCTLAYLLFLGFLPRLLGK
jgi:membrane protein required for beta-lactamase induction